MNSFQSHSITHIAGPQNLRSAILHLLTITTQHAAAVAHTRDPTTRKLSPPNISNGVLLLVGSYFECKFKQNWRTRTRHQTSSLSVEVLDLAASSIHPQLLRRCCSNTTTKSCKWAPLGRSIRTPLAIGDHRRSHLAQAWVPSSPIIATCNHEKQVPACVLMILDRVRWRGGKGDLSSTNSIRPTPHYGAETRFGWPKRLFYISPEFQTPERHSRKINVEIF